jgi:hypothetical protein
MKNTIIIFKEVLSLPLYTNDQNTINQLREAYHTIQNVRSELEDANPSVNHWRYQAMELQTQI